MSTPPPRPPTRTGFDPPAVGAVFQRRVLSVTHHPFIVGMDYAFQTPELGIMCLELVTGGDLQVIQSMVGSGIHDLDIRWRRI